MNLFERARIKITLLYFLVGIIIASVAGYFMYFDITAIIASTLQLLHQIIVSGIGLDQETVAKVLTQNIDGQVEQMNLAIGFWLVLALVFSSWLLAGIALGPVRRAMKRQERFMANISHELRTPLSVMRASTEAALLAGRDVTIEELILTKQSNLEELDRMSKIIEFLFNFSNIENRMNRLTFVPVDLAEIANKAAAFLAQRARERSVNLRLELEPVLVSGNATALEEVMVNLLKNAITYTPESGSITITAGRRRGSPFFSVEDTGVGIAEKDLPNIFDAFYRGENAHRGRENRSSGLGLAIVKEIATLHRASLSVKSESGKGTKIILRFPGRFTRWLSFTLSSS